MRNQDSGAGGIAPYSVVNRRKRGLGPGAAGQSGDTQGLPDLAEAGSESIAELIEEGQYFEAELIEGVERAEIGELSDVRTRQVSEEDVPLEYRDSK